MDQAPDKEEILELLTKQDDVIEHLELQLEYCRKEMTVMREYCRQKDLEIEKLTTTTVPPTVPQDLAPNSEEHHTVIVEQRLKLAELEFALERECLAAKSRDIERGVETQTARHEIARLEEERKLARDAQFSAHAKAEAHGKAAAEWKAKFEGLKTQSSEQILRLESRLEICAQREAQLEEHIKQVLAENSETRREKIQATARIAALIDETTTLRSKILEKSRNSADFDRKSEMKDFQKLISDQSHLIAALREETKILARKIEVDSKEYRHNLKKLRSEKRDLEERLTNLLKI